tara:strand:- start:30038 stop:30265 length:228 start_codon:yes stop_codon:yes gene_type:complete
MDAFDHAQELETMDRARALERARKARFAEASRNVIDATTCDDCDGPITPARRAAIPGVRLCIDCQADAESGGRHA